jgi:SAM-dependent methyltransferase
MPCTSGWWTRFFSGVVFDLQRQFRTADDTRAEADFLERHLLATGPRPSTAALLDVPCGDGRLAVELAARGHRLTGVDQAEEILDPARRSAAARLGDRASEITWHRGDMRDLRDVPGHGGFTGAFNCGNSFGYFGDPGDRAALEAVFDALAPGGRFVLESLLVAETVLPHMETRDWRLFGEAFLLMEPDYDPLRSELETTYTFVTGDRVETRHARYRVYTCRELCHLFDAVGFVDLQPFGSLAEEPYELGSPALWMVATRPR